MGLLLKGSVESPDGVVYRLLAEIYLEGFRAFAQIQQRGTHHEIPAEIIVRMQTDHGLGGAERILTLDRHGDGRSGLQIILVYDTDSPGSVIIVARPFDVLCEHRVGDDYSGTAVPQLALVVGAVHLRIERKGLWQQVEVEVGDKFQRLAF